MDDTIIMDAVIQKYFAGETSEQEEKYLLAWLEESEEHRKYFFELKSLWGARCVFEESTDLARFASFMRSTDHRIGKIAAGERSARRRKLVRWTLGAAAAVLLAVCAGTAWHFLSTPDIYRVYENTGDAVTTVTLDDGTHVWLNARTKLTLPEAFGPTQRNVQLAGAAFFEVARDEAARSSCPPTNCACACWAPPSACRPTKVRSRPKSSSNTVPYAFRRPQGSTW